MIVLGIDAAAAHCAAALVSGDTLLAAREEPMATGQAERLRPLIEEMLASEGLAWGDLDAIGVGTGPGNFTGIRIGVAFSRGLALGLGIPAIGITAFEALAFGLPDAVVIRDARLGQVHVQGFGAAALGPVTLPMGEPLAIPLTTPVLGDLAETLASLWGGVATAPRLPVAEAVARLALARAGSPQPRPAPLYLRPPDAAPPRDPAPKIIPG